MKHILFLLLLKSVLTEACSSVRYDEDPVPYLTSVLAKCDLKPRVDYECSTASEPITCHSCVLENIRVKCPAVPEYVADVEQKVFVLQTKSNLELGWTVDALILISLIWIIMWENIISSKTIPQYNCFEMSLLEENIVFKLYETFSFVCIFLFWWFFILKTLPLVSLIKFQL